MVQTYLQDYRMRRGCWIQHYNCALLFFSSFCDRNLPTATTVTEAFTLAASSRKGSNFYCREATRTTKVTLAVASTQDNDPNRGKEPPPQQLIFVPMQLAGVSVSETGLWALLKAKKTNTRSSWNDNTADNGSIDNGDETSYDNNENATFCYYPIQVTNDQTEEDAMVASSPEALTLLQLVAGVDMAGAILPPDVLSKLVVLACFSSVNGFEDNTDTQQGCEDGDKSMQNAMVAAAIVVAVRRQLPATDDTFCTTTGSYTQQQLVMMISSWLPRIHLPVCTLEEVQVEIRRGAQPPTNDVFEESGTKEEVSFSWRLQCSCQGYGSISIYLSESIVQQAYSNGQGHQSSLWYNPNDLEPTHTAVPFISLAMALRYKAPVWMMTAMNKNSTLLMIRSEQQLRERFPHYRTVAQLQQSSHRAATAVKQGFEIHQLQAALGVALRKGDTAAAQTIRAILDEKDSLEDLPVQAESDISSMQ
jgi:hypothetical protein